MSEETIPLSFTAVDNLTKAVENMTAMLERMGAVQKDTTQATEEATDATKKQGEEVKKTQSAWDVLARTYKDASDLTGELKDKYDRFREGLETAFYVVELGKTGLELLGGAYEKIAGTIQEANSAWEEQAKKTGKSASSLGLISKSADEFTKSQRALYAELGKVIERSGLFQVAYKATSDLLKSVTSFVKDNAAEWSKWGNRIGVEVAEKLIAFGVLIEENASGIARFALIFKGTTSFIAGTVDVLELWGRGLLQSIYTPIIETSKALYEFTGALAVMIGDTSPKLAQALRLSSSAFETLNKYSSSFAIENVGKVNEGMNSLISNSLELEDSFKAAFGSADAISVQESYFVRLGKRIKEAGTEYKKLFQESQGQGISTGSTGEREATNEQKRLEERLDLYNRILEKGREAASLTGDLVAFNREYYASRNLALKSLEAEAKALEVVVTRQWEGNEAQAISLETQQRMIELQAELAEIQDPIVRAETEKVRLAQIQIEEAMKLRDLEQQRFDLQTEAISQIGDYVSEAFGNVSSVIDGISESTQRMIDGFAKAVPQVTNLANSFRAYNKQGATAEQQQEAINAGIAAGAGVLSNVTASFIEDKRKQAAIEALINAAAAAASYATGNIPAGIAFTAAAVTYGAAAAFSGGGGGGGGASIAGGGIAASSPSLPNAAEERRANAEAIAEAISSQRENQPIQINLSFDNALIAADSPQAARIISDMVIPEIRNLLP